MRTSDDLMLLPHPKFHQISEKFRPARSPEAGPAAPQRRVVLRPPWRGSAPSCKLQNPPNCPPGAGDAPDREARPAQSNGKAVTSNPSHLTGSLYWHRTVTVTKSCCGCGRLYQMQKGTEERGRKQKLPIVILQSEVAFGQVFSTNFNSDD